MSTCVRLPPLLSLSRAARAVFVARSPVYATSPPSLRPSRLLSPPSIASLFGLQFWWNYFHCPFSIEPFAALRTQICTSSPPSRPSSARLYRSCSTTHKATWRHNRCFWRVCSCRSRTCNAAQFPASHCVTQSTRVSAHPFLVSAPFVPAAASLFLLPSSKPSVHRQSHVCGTSKPLPTSKLSCARVHN